jgi:WD40 repeat protein
MSTIFISHSSRDNALARELERRLERDARHVCVFLDFDPSKGIVAGRSWERTLYRKLRACRVVIAICTDNYLESQWCFAEIALARMEGKELITLYVDGYTGKKETPSIMMEKQIIDLRTDREEGFERLWIALDALEVLGVDSSWDPAECPYLGLSAYQEKHAPIFFGREDEIRQGITMLERGAPGLTMLLGASGSGKSSFVRAGILPRLRWASDTWIVVDPFRPGSDPFAALALALEQSFNRQAPEDAGRYDHRTLKRDLAAWTPSGREPKKTAADSPLWLGQFTDTTEAPAHPQEARLLRLIEQLEAFKSDPPSGAGRSLQTYLDLSIEDLRRLTAPGADEPPGPPPATPLIAIAEDMRGKLKRPGTRVIIVIDQFEELLAAGTDDPRMEHFLAMIQTSLEAKDNPLQVFATMRSDYLDAFQQINARIRLDYDTMSLGPLAPDMLQRAIEAPARLGAIELEEGLANRILHDAGSTDSLPLVSYTLWLLWHRCRAESRITRLAYDELGGVAGAIGQEADSILARARRAGLEDQFRKAMLQMVRLGADGNYARQPVAWNAPALQPVKAFFEDLQERRLLVPRAEDGVPLVEVAHEALFRTWRPLRTWIDEERADFLLKQQLDQAAEDWQDNRRGTDFLWRGVRLAQAVALLERGALEGDAPALQRNRAFVGASEALRRRQVFRRRASLATVAILLTAFSGYALFEEHEAKRLQRAAWAQQQALEAMTMLATDATQSVALARGAVCVTQVFDGIVLPGAHTALNQAVEAVRTHRFIDAHDLGVRQIGFLPNPPAGNGADGQAGSERLISLGSEGTAKLWSVPAASAPRCAGIPSPTSLPVPAERFAAGSVGGPLATHGADADGGVTLFDLSDDRERPAVSVVLPVQGKNTALAMSRSGRFLASGYADGSITLTASRGSDWTMPGLSLTAHASLVSALAFDDTGTTLASAAQDGSVSLWDTTRGEPLLSLGGHEEAVTTLAFAGDILASGSWDKTIILWDTATGAQLRRFRHDAVVSDLLVTTTQNGRRVLVSASWDRTVRLWDVETGRILTTLDQGAPVTALALAPRRSGKPSEADAGTFRLASGGWDGATYLWTLAGPSLTATASRLVSRHTEAVTGLAFTADGTRLVSGGDDGRIGISRVSDPLDAYDWESGLAVSPNRSGANSIAVITSRSVKMLDGETGAVRDIVTPYSPTVDRIAFSKTEPDRLALLGDRLYEYALRSDDLMICADRLVPPSSLAMSEGDTMTARCEAEELDGDFASIWSRATFWLTDRGRTQ